MPDYSVYKIPKPRGGFRLIEEPGNKLKATQRKLIPVWLKIESMIQVSNKDNKRCSYGLASKEYDAVANAGQHCGKRIIVKADIKDFYLSTTNSHIISIIESNKSLIGPELYETAHKALPQCMIFTELGSHLPTGAPTSPVLSSIAGQPIDKGLLELSEKYNLRYTRYIDDLTFSGNQIPQDFIKRIIRLVTKAGYSLNYKKTKVLYTENDKNVIVTGVNVKKLAKATRRIKHILRVGLDKYAQDGKDLDDKMHGYLSFLYRIDPQKAAYYKEYFHRRTIRWKELLE